MNNPKTKSTRLNVAVLFGGRSVEHEVSVISALQLTKAIDTDKYKVIPVYISTEGEWYTGDILFDKTIFPRFNSFKSKLTRVTLLPEPNQPGLKFYNRDKYLPVDVYLPIFHGENGEHGNLQGLFELAEVDYAGMGVLSSAIAMNKHLCKKLLKSFEVNVLGGASVDKFDFLDNPEKEVSTILDNPDLKNYPFFVKPCNRGSSVGISKVSSKEELIPALIKVFKNDLQAVVEPMMTDMFEINVAVLGYGRDVKASVVEVPYSEQGFLSYEDKYMSSNATKKTGQGKDGGQGMESLDRAINPKDLDEKIKKEVRETAVKVFTALNCSGNARFDFMHDNQTGEVILNEINTIPGSLAFYLWAESEPELLYTDLAEKLIEIAQKKGQEKASVESFFGFKALR